MCPLRGHFCWLLLMVPYPLAMADIEFILNVEHIDRDIFRGPVVESNLQRTFGGQVAAQTLVAAT